MRWGGPTCRVANERRGWGGKLSTSGVVASVLPAWQDGQDHADVCAELGQVVAEELPGGVIGDLAVALGESAVARQRSDSALALVESWLETGKERDYLLALIYHALGRTADADAALARLREAGNHDEWASLKVIEVYAYLGQTDEAFEWLAKAVNQVQRAHPRAPATMAWKVELRHSPFVTTLHEDPRWQAWLAEG